MLLVMHSYGYLSVSLSSSQEDEAQKKCQHRGIYFTS